MQIKREIMSSKFDNLYNPDMNHYEFLVAQVNAIDLCETEEEIIEFAKVTAAFALEQINDPDRQSKLC